MSSQVDSARVRVGTLQVRRPAVPALSFVILVAVLNSALNGVVAAVGSALPASLQFEYTVAAPLGPAGAALLAVGSGVLAVCSLALFVLSVDGAGPTALSPPEVLRRFGRATVVAVAGVFATALGLAVLVIPGLVVLAYLPYVFVAVVVDGQTVSGAIRTSHARIVARPGPVVATALGTVAVLLALALGGVLTALFPPTVEFVAGGTASAFVVLAGTYLLTGLYRRAGSRHTHTAGQL